MGGLLARGDASGNRAVPRRFGWFREKSPGLKRERGKGKREGRKHLEKGKGGRLLMTEGWVSELFVFVS